MSTRNPRVLIVTPEITYLPRGMGSVANKLKAKAGGLADVSATLVGALFELGADVHVALPHYRRMFHIDVGGFIEHELRIYKKILPDSRIHLAQDRIFYYRDSIYSDYYEDSQKIALAFQREVINNIVPNINPDLIHCNDWMTGLIPAIGRRMGIPCLLTLHNIHTQALTLEKIENSGIDAAEFWRHLYFTRVPNSYEETRSTNPVDLLASGIFAAHFVNTVSPTFLNEVCDGRHSVVPWTIRNELNSKRASGCAFGILNAPDPSYNTQKDASLKSRYKAENHVRGKQKNKLHLQAKLGLAQNEKAPMFFWPSRLDPAQKGPQLLSHILYDIMAAYAEDGLQMVFVANGSYQQPFRDIINFHGLKDRVAVCDFDEDLSRLGYAASDFLLMPSSYEPCGLSQMIGGIYGSLPIVHDTGGLHDTVKHLDAETGTGNGFVFESFDSNGLRWAIDRAMDFFHMPDDIRKREVARIMRESAATFTHSATAEKYIELYENMLRRPLVNDF